MVAKLRARNKMQSGMRDIARRRACREYAALEAKHSALQVEHAALETDLSALQVTCHEFSESVERLQAAALLDNAALAKLRTKYEKAKAGRRAAKTKFAELEAVKQEVPVNMLGSDAGVGADYKEEEVGTRKRKRMKLTEAECEGGGAGAGAEVPVELEGKRKRCHVKKKKFSHGGNGPAMEG
ncbi:hypothetical protein B0H11DRAFT_2088481 [Mycena galericulata]|nr:hypothetical protein B0H11DRAFT_2088481 [Mycena galericulata]